MFGFTEEDRVRFSLYHKQIREELTIIHQYQPTCKDILIVVRNELELFKNCIESIEEHTSDYNLFIWDNDSDEETKKYLKSLNATVLSSESNIGFIIPNNRLIEKGTSPYVILLNSDTIVRRHWSEALISAIQQKGYSQTGYCGSQINEEGKGVKSCFGSDIDYVCGWCFCIHRDTFKKFGLFDEKNLHFAYGEDSDFSFRLIESGYQIYALHLGLVYHIGNQTIKKVAKEMDVKMTFDKNHKYIRTRWKDVIDRRKHSKE